MAWKGLASGVGRVSVEVVTAFTDMDMKETSESHAPGKIPKEMNRSHFNF